MIPSLFTSILKDIAEQTIPKTSAVTKHFNKPWFSDTCKDAIKERNRALERFKREPTEGNLNAYRIARAKARRNILHSKKTSWRNYVSKMNSQTLVKYVWNRIRKIKGKNPITLPIHHLSVNDRLKLLMQWQITFPIILPLLSAQIPLHLFIGLKTIHLIMLRYTTGPSLWRSCMMLCVDPMIHQQDQMKYINF